HGDGHRLAGRWGGGSGGDERVGAELGQDVAGLADDLAGLGQGGDLAVGAVLDRRLVVVAGGGGAGVGLAGLIDHPAQYLRSLAGHVPGGALAIGAVTVTPSPANRTALRQANNRPAPPSPQAIATAASAPTPCSRVASHL